MYLDHVWNRPSLNELVVENPDHSAMRPIPDRDGISLVHARVTEVS